MKSTMPILAVLVSLASSTNLFAQLQVTTQLGGDATTGKQLIQAMVKGGSGNYSYAWGLTTPGVVPENSASEVLLVPVQAAEYIVFVRDRKTGDTAYSTVVVEASVAQEKHLIRMPGEDYKLKLRYSATGAVGDSPVRK